MFAGKSVKWAIAAAAMLGLLLAACGGDDDDDGGSSFSGGGGGSGSDKDYVAAMCKASLKFQNSLEEAATKDPSKISNPDEAFKVLSGPLDAFLADIKKANPPKDVKTYHDKVVKALSDASSKLKKDKDITAFATLGDSLADAPQEISDRLDKVAQDNPDCEKAGFTFSD